MSFVTGTFGVISAITNPITRTTVQLSEPVECATPADFHEFIEWTDAIFKAGWDATRDRFPVGWDPAQLDPSPFVQWKKHWQDVSKENQ